MDRPVPIPSQPLKPSATWRIPSLHRKNPRNENEPVEAFRQHHFQSAETCPASLADLGLGALLQATGNWFKEK